MLICTRRTRDAVKENVIYCLILMYFNVDNVDGTCMRVMGQVYGGTSCLMNMKSFSIYDVLMHTYSTSHYTLYCSFTHFAEYSNILNICI